MLEGMVIEEFTDQVFSLLRARNVFPVNHATLIVQRWVDGKPKLKAAAVWIKEDGKGMQDYLQALSTIWPVIPVRYDGTKQSFFTSNSYMSGLPLPEQECHLHDKLIEWTKQKPKYISIDEKVRDRVRQMRSFWGFLEATPLNLLDDVVLPRVFKNFGVNPFFNSAWDVDRIVTDNGKLWSLEIKHKYPAIDRRRNELYFGLNEGAAEVITEMHEGEISSLHIIAIKPVWNKKQSPDYLRNNRSAAEKCMLVALVLSPHILSKYSKNKGTSGSHTTYSGRGETNYLKIPATEFVRIGMLTDKSETIAKRIHGVMHNANLPNVTDKELLSLKVK
jgi:hypothetical protein